MFAASQATNERYNVHPATRADDSINAGNPLHNLVTVALGHAAGSDQHLVGAFDLCQIAQCRYGFLASTLDEATGIDN